MTTTLKPLHEKTIHVNNIEISYYDEGNSDTPIIFLHGFPFNKNSWKPQIEQLNATCRVIAYDYRGFGNSKGDTSQLSIDQLSSDLLSFIDALKLKQVILCGISMGGYVALHTASRAPQKLKALILCNTQCIADSDEGKKKRNDTIAQIEKEGLGNFSQQFAEAVLGDNKSQELQTELRQMIRTANPESVIAMLKALAERKETCTASKNFKIPTLIISGKKDKVIPVSQSELLFNTIPNAEMKSIETAGHMCNLERPEEFNDFVEEFCSKL